MFITNDPPLSPFVEESKDNEGENIVRNFRFPISDEEIKNSNILGDVKGGIQKIVSGN